MAHSVSSSTAVTWSFVQYGVPFLLFLLLNLLGLHAFRFRLWRMQLWLHRASARIISEAATRPKEVGGMAIDAKGFDALHHYHDVSQSAPRIRLALAPVLAFGVCMLIAAPMAIILAWGATIYWNIGDATLAIALVLGCAALVSLYYAVNYWYASGFRLSTHVQVLFGFSIFCYFLLAMALSFLSANVSFFGLSVHFLVINYMLVTELVSRAEQASQLPAATILQAEEFAGGGSGGAVGGQIGERLSTEEKLIRQRTVEKSFFAKFKAEHDAVKPSAAASAGSVAGADLESEAIAAAKEDAGLDSDEDVPSDGEDEKALEREDASAVTLINIHASASKMTAQFSSVLHGLMAESEGGSRAHTARKQQVKLYLLSLSVLLAYSLMVYYYSSANVDPADIDPATGVQNPMARYLGFIVSGILVVWDTLVYAYAAYNGRVIDDLTKILVLGGSRVALIAFGFQGWFLGVCCLYGAGGIYLSYRIVDRRRPFGSFQLVASRKRIQRFSEFCATVTNPDEEAGMAGGGDNALLRTMSSRSRGSLGIGIAEFVLLILTVLFFMALCVSYQSHPRTYTGGVSAAVWEQYQIGLVVWYAVAMFLMSVWTIRYWLTTGWKVSWRSGLLTLATQVAFTAGAIAIYAHTGSVIVLVWLVCGPIFVLSLIGTYMHCVKVDWHVLSPSHLRNPPNLPFIPAILTCGLQRDDYRMLLNIALSFGMMVVIGLAITIGLQGSAIGWSITFVLFILVSSLVPLVKYLKTLSIDRTDGVLLFLWLVAHIAFFALQYTVQGGSGMSDQKAFLLWGACAAYPTILANILAYHLFQENGQQLTKATAQVFALSGVVLIIVVIIAFFTLGSSVGGMILGAAAMAACAAALFVRWVAGSYTLPKYLRWTVGFAFVCLLVAGVVLGVLLPEEDQGFWAFSGSWFLLMLFVAVLAYGDKARLKGKGGASSTATFRYSSCIFPVYYYDRRNDSNPVRPANMHMGLSCAVFGMGLCWCAACMVTVRVNIGLGCSALCWLAFYTFARQRSISANKQLMSMLPFLSEAVVRASKESARESQIAGSSILFDNPQPAVFGLARWGVILAEMLAANIDPQPVLKRKQNALKKKLGLGRSCFCTPLPTSAQQLDDHMLLLERLNDWSAACAKVHFKVEAHFYFLLMANAAAAVAAEETAMKNFCGWLKREKRGPPPGLQPVELDPAISNHDIYTAPAHWSTTRILQMQSWKDEYRASLVAAAADNENNRVKEAKAMEVREKRMEEREKAKAERERNKEAEAAAAAAAGVVVPPPPVASLPSGSSAAAAAATHPVEKEFWRIVSEHQRTGVQWEDPDFPCNDDSLYLSGERDSSKGAMNALPIDGWMRPRELLAALAADNPGQQISTEPRLFIDGFDLSDIVQGNIGTCYYLSAIGCLGIRELATPRYPLLSNIFTLESPTAEYNACGAFLVRFYRRGQIEYVIIDDRLPTAQNNFAFSHSKVLNEMWVALLEKAYAKLFTCYEAIEAGMISQALCDLSNGASEQIQLKGADGTIAVNPEALWVQLQDSVKSGYLIGAGSNTGSDTSFVNGIAQGHAYMLVRIFSDAAGSEKLVQLQNPHGHGEWDGDWADSSPKWTQWWRQMLPNPPVDDGKFWMSFGDFLSSYANVYICRLLPVRMPISTEWRDHTAAGVSNPYHNPTFIVQAKTPCKVWVELEQQNKRGRKKRVRKPGDEPGEGELTEEQQLAISSNGYAFIMFAVLDNGGRRVEKLTKENVKMCANKWKMVNERQIGAELFIDQPDTPLTIVALNKHKGWETEFTMSVFAADESVTFRMLPEEPAPTK